MSFPFMIHFHLSARSLKNIVLTILWQAWTSTIYFPIFTWVELLIFGLMNYFLRRIQSKISIETQQIFVFMKTSWSRFQEVFHLRLQKASSRSLDQDEYIRLTHRSLEDVFKTSWSKPIYSPWSYVFKTSCKNVFKTSSRHLQDVFKTSLRCLQDIFKTSN